MTCFPAHTGRVTTQMSWAQLTLPMYANSAERGPGRTDAKVWNGITFDRRVIKTDDWIGVFSNLAR